MTESNKDRLPAESKIFLTDVSSAEIDETCGMRFWMSKLESGHGILKGDTVVDKLLNVEIHNDLQALSLMNDISPINIQRVIDGVLEKLTEQEKQDTQKMELLYRRLGWFAAFAIFKEPEIRSAFITHYIPAAVSYDADPLWPTAYPDRLVESRGNHEFIYWEYVPCPAGISQDKWLRSWHYNIRLHLGLAAAAQNVDADKAPQFGQVMALSMGFRSHLDNRLNHPYVWGYYNKISQEWSFTTDNKVGTWERAPVWKYPGGIVSWVRLCGKGIAEAQFRMSPPVYLNKDILSMWIARRLHREREIDGTKDVARVNQHLRNVYFPKATKECMPAAGEACPYLHACWNKTLTDRPLSSNQYVKNNPSAFGGV